MLTKELRTIYDTLKEIVGIDGNYKVIEADDIVEKLPEDFKLSLQDLSLAIKELKDREYLKIKFFTLEEYCLQVLPKEEELIQLVEDIERVKGVEEVKPKEKKVKEKKVKENVPLDSSKKAFLSGFIGSMVGGIIVTVITVIVLVIAF